GRSGRQSPLLALLDKGSRSGVVCTAVNMRLDNRIFRSEATTSTVIRVPVGILSAGLFGGGTMLTREPQRTSQLLPWGVAGDQRVDGIADDDEVPRRRHHGAVHLCRAGLWRDPHDGLSAAALYPALAGENPEVRALRVPLLYTGITLTMMWGA